MLAWVVIDRQQPRQAAPLASLLSTPVIPLPHLSPLLPTPYGHSYTTTAPQPLCNQSVTHSFDLDGGVPPPALPLHPIPILSRAKPRDPLSFHILAHSFALFLRARKTQLFCFQAIPHSLQKKHPGCGGRGLLFFATGRLPQRKQHRLGGRGISDGLELRVLPPERLRHFHLRALQDADELQGVDDRLALEVIVGHHKRLASPLRDFADPRNPRCQLLSGVKIVVALMRGNRCIIAEPCVVQSPVQPHVPDGRGS